MFDKYREQFAKELQDIQDGGMWKEEKTIEGTQGAEISVDGKELLNFCSNNYLGLAASPELAKAAKEGIDTHGFGMGSVRFICGTSTIHKNLEEEISSFFKTEDAILYTSCFDANTGLFETLLKEGDAIFSEELNHASIIDGVRLCKAERFRYLHSDIADLERQIQEFQARPMPDTATRAPRMLIATDGVFSMDGDTAKLSAICDVAEKYGVMVMVDDSHASGVLGGTGRGSIEQEGVMGRVDILTSTFGKALGGAGGGFTAGRREIIELLRQRSRTTLFSNSLPPAIAEAALYVLKNFDEKFAPLRVQLAENTRYFRGGMEQLGFALGGDGKHPITPVMLGDEKAAVAMARALFAKGIYVRGFTYPVVPKGKARIRVQISAAHTKEHMDAALQAFAEVKKEME